MLTLAQRKRHEGTREDGWTEAGTGTDPPVVRDQSTVQKHAATGIAGIENRPCAIRPVGCDQGGLALVYAQSAHSLRHHAQSTFSVTQVRDLNPSARYQRDYIANGGWSANYFGQAENQGSGILFKEGEDVAPREL